jgi:hypothetical protein
MSEEPLNQHRIEKKMDRQTMVDLALEKAGIWKRNLHDVAGGIATWNEQGLGSAGLAYVADGRRCKPCRERTENGRPPAVCDNCYSRKGRGTTALDKGRAVQSGGLIRVDMVSCKTDGLTKSGGFPSKVEVSTGKPETLKKLVTAIENGASLPTLIFVSGEDSDGNPKKDGYALFIDLAALIRSHGIEDGVFKKGTAPAVWRRFGSRRNCGATSRVNKPYVMAGHDPVAPGSWMKRADWTFPCIDDDGCKWTAAWWKHYPQLFVNISKKYLQAHGLKWVACNVDDLPAMLEEQSWSDMGYYR